MRIREIDGLRAFAALAVVATHYLSWVKHSGAQFGWLGVDLFFVISGYLITTILMQLEPTGYFRTFYGRRAFRIFPPYFFVLAIYFVWALISHHPGSSSLWLKYVFYYASLVFSNNTEYGIDLAIRVGLAVLWSLSVEELFYMLWAPVVRFTDRKRFWTLLAALIVLAPTLRWSLHSHSPLEIFTFYCRLDGLALGAVVAVVMQHRDRNRAAWNVYERRLDAACLMMACVAVGFFAWSGSDYQQLKVSVLGVTIADLAFASMLLYVVRHSGEDGLLMPLLRQRTLRSIGMVSYSLYLVHYPLLIVSERLCERLHLSRRLNAVSTDVLALTLSFSAAYCMWYGFEAYMLRIKERLFPRHTDKREKQPAELHVAVLPPTLDAVPAD